MFNFDIILSTFEFVADDQEDEEVQRKVVRLGPKPKQFLELGIVQQRKVTQSAFDSVKEVAETRQIPVVNLAGYMLKRYVTNFSSMKHDFSA